MTVTLYELTGAEEDRQFSPYCWRTRMALAHKGIAVETVPWRFTEKERIAPAGQSTVPVMIDKGKWIGESSVIADYLEETFPDRPSLFGGPGGRGLSRFFVNWTALVIHMGIFPMVVLDIFNHLHEKDKAYFRKSREERFSGKTLEQVQADRDQRVTQFRQSLQPMRLTLQSLPFLGGNQPLYPDYVAFGAFQWARAISPFKLLEASDPIAAWRERMLDLHGGLARKAKGYPV